MNMKIGIAFLVLLSLSIFLIACGTQNPHQQDSAQDAVAEATTCSLIEASEDGRYIKSLFEVQIQRNIPYGEAVDYLDQKQALLLDIYTPRDDTEINRPAIIWIHGGGFFSGSKDSGIERILAEVFARKGYVCLTINYRLQENPIKWPDAFIDAITDAHAAMDWAIAHSAEYGIDPTHIAIGGHSAGGITVTGLAYHDDIPNSRNAQAPAFAVINMAGGSFGLGDIDEPAPPCLIIHGTEDDTVPYSGAVNCADTLTAAGVDATLHTLEDGTHDFYPCASEVEDVVAQFLYRALTGVEPDMAIRKGIEVAYTEEYHARQIDLIIDGDLSEWVGSDGIPLGELKEAGTSLPAPKDFSGEAMVGWNQDDPARVYFAMTITDDILSYNENAYLYESDSVEFYLDLTPEGNGPRIPLCLWIFGPNSQEFMGTGDTDSIEWTVRTEGDTYYYEGALDVTQITGEGPLEARDFIAASGHSVGLSIAYNDCENGIREHQIGWIGGPIQFPRNFGRLVFD